MRELVNDVYGWPVFSRHDGYRCNGYLVCAPDGNLCIDPVDPSAEELADLARRGVSRILLTNRNHVRDANRVRARTGARTAIHPEDAGYALGHGAELDDALHIGERIGPLRVVDASGKSPGEVAFHWPERRILIVGDSIVGTPLGQCGLPPDEVMDDASRLRANVRALLSLELDTLLPGNGEPILSGAKDRLRELVETFA